MAVIAGHHHSLMKHIAVGLKCLRDIPAMLCGQGLKSIEGFCNQVWQRQELPHSQRVLLRRQLHRSPLRRTIGVSTESAQEIVPELGSDLTALLL